MKKQTKKKTDSEKKRLYILNRRRPVFFLLLCFLFVSAIIIIFTQTGLVTRQIRLSDFKLGKIADRDIILSHDISYVDKKATRIKIDAERRLISPVYKLNTDINNKINNNIDSFLSLLAEQKASRFNVRNAYLQVQTKFPGMLTEKAFGDIYKIDDTSSFFMEVKNFSRNMLETGIISLKNEHVESERDIIDIQHPDHLIDEINISDCIQKNDIGRKAAEYGKSRELPQNMINALISFSESFLSENTFFNREETDKKTERILSTIPEVRKTILAGELIIEAGFPITEEDIQELEAIGEYSFTINITSIFAAILFVILLFLSAVFNFIFYMRSKRLSNQKIYMLLVFVTVFVILAVLLSRLLKLSEWMHISLFLPTALFCMIVAIIISIEAGFSMSLIFSALVLLISRLDVNAFLFAFMSGIGGVIAVQGAKKRINLINASLVLSAMHVFFILTISLLGNYSLSSFFKAVGWSVLNGFICGILNLGILPFVEHILNAPTPFRLMELSDLNTALFRKMITVAPGTYGHSVSVANLAESACREIGADPLLARVGAYYHDIGKIDQPEYFIENQSSVNKHDELKPNLSAAIIKSHLKIGIERAKEIGLPQEVIEIISEHHGNSIINYFYNQAKKGKENVLPEDFSYSGNPPSSKEAAVVMLADSVEAASRTIDKPTIAKLDKFIWKIIMDKMECGQFDNSPVSFRELKIIKDTFVHILAGHFHSRIEYPDKE
ncbi:MAG: HDIG domain-containing protein [Spirochaetales bacterium]|nr:HDIG domain-containing protein [Spirochaetales bacterium]